MKRPSGDHEGSLSRNVVSQVSQIVPRRIHHINVLVVVALGEERRWSDRPETTKDDQSQALVVGQATHITPRRIHHVNLRVAIADGRRRR